MRSRLRRLFGGVVVTALAGSAVAVVGVQSAAAAGFAPGNIVVARVGSGDAALSSAATAVFLDEYTPSGTLVQSVPLPTATGAGKRLTLSGSATSEGALARSADGRYLTLAGYDADPGTASVAGTTAAAVNRVVARVDGNGTVDSSTAISDTFSANNVRGAVTDDGSRFWVVGANGGVRLANLGATGTSTQINSANPVNLRGAVIAGGQLYVSTGSGTTGVYSVGAGLPTTGGQTPQLTVPAASPYGVAALDRDPAVPGIDTVYVADDTSATGGILKFSSDGTTWTARGTFRPANSAVRGLTGEVTGSGATLFATTTNNLLVKVDETAAPAATITATATTLRTGAANTALRGVAFAPGASTSAPSITTQPQDTSVASGASATLSVAATGTGPLTYQWYTGTAGDTANPIAGATADTYPTPALTASASYWVRVSGPGGQADSRTAAVAISGGVNTPPTITGGAEIALTAGDPDNPPAVRTVTVADAETPASGLTVTVTSSDPAIVTGGSTGTGDVRTLTFAPVAVGRATLTVTVSDGSATASTAVPVAVSAALPAGRHNYYGASDASTAIDLGDGAMVVADDETNVLRVHDRDHSRYPAQSLDVRAAGLALRDTDVTREIDIEAAARFGDTIFWVGSQGQNSSAKTRLNRQELFTTTVTGTGTGATLALGGSYQHLRDDLVTWDQAGGNALGLAAAAARAPEGDGAGGPTGVNIEGAEFAPDGALLLGFRGPLTADGKAIVIPVTNPNALVTANPTTGAAATFGTPLRWDLGGKGIREIRRNGANQYLIIAGPSDAGTGAAGEYRFYSWDGDATHQPVPRAGSLDAFTPVGKPEAIVDVPNPLLDSSSAQILSDDGDTVFYGDGTIAKELPLWQRKAVGATVAIGAAPACTSSVVTIGSVQGTTDTSPRNGQTVSVRGTVVADYEGAQPALRGFYLQDAGDGDANTSDGIFVFDNGADLVSNGDVVQVTGPVSEYQGQTQITASAAGVQGCGAQAAVAPTVVTLPVPDPNYLERVEGMLVKFDQTLTVTEHFQLGRFGQVVVSAGGRLLQPTSVIRATDQAAVQAKQTANNLSRLIIDDATQAQNPDPIVFGRGGQPLSASNTLRGGDTVTAPVGVLTYTWAGNAASGNAFRLRPIGALGGSAVFDAADPRPTDRPDVGAATVRVTGANLLNFFNTYTGCKLGTQGATTDCRGATDDTEYQRQLAKEVAALRSLNADVTGIMEIENDGYGPTSAIQALVDALNAADGPGSWAFIDPDAATGVVDVAGTDAIKAGILYRTAAVTPVATFVDQNPLFERRPVAETFRTADGGRFTVVANHFKSKGSCPTSGPDTDQGDGQSCWNAHRTAQANELAGWIGSTVVPGAGDPDVLIVGDLNSYAGEDPIAALETAGYVNMPKAFHGDEAYSYVFDGQWGYLDHALASRSLVSQVTGAAEAHTNADEPSVLDYNTDFKTPGQVASLYAPDRFRTSDHDPVLVGLRPGAPATISGTPGAAAVGEPYSFAFTLSGPAAVSPASGTLPAGLFLSEEGVLSGTPTVAGESTFTVRASNSYGATETTATVRVTAGVSTTRLTATPNPVAVGDPTTLTATVTGPVPATGSVRFLDGTTVLGDAALVDGSASLSATLAVGNHPVTAVYSGNPNLAGSTSAEVRVDVPAKAATTTTVTGSADPSILGGAVRFTATVAGSGGLVPSGTVQFTVDGKNTGAPVALVNGVAVSAPVSGLALGAHQVRAVYSGSSFFVGSTGSVGQYVQFGIRILSPADNSKARAGDIIPVRFRLVDANGNPIPPLASALVFLTGRVTVSVTGVQTLASTPALYDPFGDSFVVLWKSAKKPTGQVTVTVSVNYPDGPVQKVPVRVTLN
ncbi:ExeM/NucH family extracellular endonuclease [Actinokineospora enzanensis]|uniref:ExeM/NucH family extracellular endonuclease n=1 Tax=Actinokineospora enzanensis TaxID=155975 RepID=UPI00035D29AD|nr:ExeM/NucH family extracellular endonuclease [Actinokineospora enzanensis]